MRVKNTVGESSICRGEESGVGYILGLIGTKLIYAEVPHSAVTRS